MSCDDPGLLVIQDDAFSLSGSLAVKLKISAFPLMLKRYVQVSTAFDVPSTRGNVGAGSLFSFKWPESSI